MSTIESELTKFINPELTWKTIVKGNRSARKPVARSFIMGMELSEKYMGKVEDKVSDTEKNGVAILGRRFGDRIEHVPLKKRRFMYRSPSPPQNTSLFLDVPETMDRKQQGRGIRAPSPVKSNQKISGVSDNKLDHGDVFSGIEILADVACNNSMVNDGDQEERSQVKDLKQCGGESTTAMELSIQTTVPTKEIKKEDLSVEENLSMELSIQTTVPANEIKKEDLSVEENLSMEPSIQITVPANEMKNENLSVEDSVGNTAPANEIKKEASVIEDGVMNLHETPTIKDVREVEGTASSQDIVFPWDLNVDLHAEADSVPSDLLAEQSNSLDRSEVEHTPLSPVMQKKTEFIGKSVGKIHVLPDKIENNCKSQIAESFSNGFLEVVDSKVKSASNHIGERNYEECVPGSSNFAQECSACDGDPKASSEIVDKARLYCDRLSGQDLPKENRASLQGKVPIMENKPDDTCSVLSSPVQKLEESPCTMIYVNGVCSASASKSIEDSCQPVVSASFNVVPGIQVGDNGKQDLSDNRENNVTVAAKVDSQFVAVVNKEGNEASVADPAETTLLTVAASDEVMQKSSVDSIASGREIRSVPDNIPSRSLVKVAACDASDDSYESDVYQTDKVHTIGIGNTLELQGGYDFEDGELRESDACYYWDKDGEDGEVERLDYGSESDEVRLCGTDIEEEVKVERGSSPQSASLRDESVSPKTRTSNVTTNRDFQAGVAGSRALQSELLSNGEGPRSTHNNRTITRSSSYGFHDLCSRDEDANSKRFLGRNGIASDLIVKSPGKRPYVNHDIDSERQCSSSYHGTYLSGPMRRKNITEGRRPMNYSDSRGSEAGRFSGHTGGQIRRQFMHSSHGIYECNRRRTPTNRDDGYVPAGMLPLRDNSPIRSRYRYPHVAYRGIREGFHRPILEEGSGHTSRMAHRLSRHERSLSPIDRRRSQYPIAYKKPLSGSRSRSPITYIPRERQARPDSRSPVFRSDARIDRGRMPVHKQHYATQYYEEEFIMPPRNHVSPRQGSRWFEERHGDFENFRRRRSPVRIFRGGQRFDSGRPMRRMNTGDEFGSVMQSRKFSDMGGGGRRDEFEDMDDDRPKHRYEMVRQVRRHDAEGVVQRFRNNAEESS